MLWTVLLIVHYIEVLTPHYIGVWSKKSATKWQQTYETFSASDYYAP